MIVVDASVLAPALGDDGADGDRARSALAGQALAAPELIDLEVASVFRRQFLAGQLDTRRAGLALTDLAQLRIRRVPHRLLVARCWELRSNLTLYDACYVVVAELLDAILITADGGISTAPGLRCRMELIR